MDFRKLLVRSLVWVRPGVPSSLLSPELRSGVVRVMNKAVLTKQSMPAGQPRGCAMPDPQFPVPMRIVLSVPNLATLWVPSYPQSAPSSPSLPPPALGSPVSVDPVISHKSLSCPAHIQECALCTFTYEPWPHLSRIFLVLLVVTALAAPSQDWPLLPCTFLGLRQHLLSL